MFVRRRPLLRAAAVGGGAYMAGKARQRHQNERQEMAASQSAPAPETAGSAAGQPAAAAEAQPAGTTGVPAGDAAAS